MWDLQEMTGPAPTPWVVDSVHRPYECHRPNNSCAEGSVLRCDIPGGLDHWGGASWQVHLGSGVWLEGTGHGGIFEGHVCHHVLASAACLPWASWLHTCSLSCHSEPLCMDPEVEKLSHSTRKPLKPWTETKFSSFKWFLSSICCYWRKHRWLMGHPEGMATKAMWYHRTLRPCQ